MASGILKSISALSLSTVGSRILGLLRDATFFACFGSNIISSAFIIAFTIPNLFRRLLGEGALSSAFIPIFNEALEKDSGPPQRLLNQTITYLGGGLLGLIALLTSLYFLAVAPLQIPEIWETAAPMLFLMLPYAALICCAAIITAALNSLNRFLLPSLSPIILNIVMIATMLGSVYLLDLADLKLAYALCLGVLLGGLLQLLLPALQIRSMGWHLRPDTGRSDDFKHVCRLFWSASGAAAAIQLNLLITRVIAFGVSDTAVSQLYLASRITEFPLGIFTIAITTVLFPKLARLVSQDQLREFQTTSLRGLTLILTITIPAAVGCYMLADPIIGILFQWGRFDQESVQAVAPVLAIYAISIPILSMVGYFTKILHSQKRMKTALRITLASICINIILCLILAQPYGVYGLAWATNFSAIFQATILATVSMKGFGMKPLQMLGIDVAKITVSCILMWGLLNLAQSWINEESGRISTALSLFGTILIAAILYFAVGWILGLFRSLRWLTEKHPQPIR
jgi:putative peptidoglycan lipid II flippase